MQTELHFVCNNITLRSAIFNFPFFLCFPHLCLEPVLVFAASLRDWICCYHGFSTLNPKRNNTQNPSLLIMMVGGISNVKDQKNTGKMQKRKS